MIESDLVDETVGVEGVGAGEEIEDAAENGLVAELADLVAAQFSVSRLESSDLEPHLLGGGGVVVHFLLQLVDARVVVLERLDDLVLEAVDDDEVGEPGEEVVDLQQRALLQQGDGRVDVSLLLR